MAVLTSGLHSFHYLKTVHTHNSVYSCALLATIENNKMGSTSFTKKAYMTFTSVLDFY